MSNHIPEKFTPNWDQLRNASVQNFCALLANQSGKTVYPGHTCPTYSVPFGFFMNTSLSRN